MQPGSLIKNERLMKWAYDPNKPIYHPAFIVRLVSGIIEEYETYMIQERQKVKAVK